MFDEIRKKYDEIYGYGKWTIRKVSSLKRYGYPSLSVQLSHLNVKPGDIVALVQEDDKLAIYNYDTIHGKIDKSKIKIRKVSRSSSAGNSAMNVLVDLIKLNIKPGDYVVVAYLEDKIIIHKA